MYREGRKLCSLEGYLVILVDDDGIVTGLMFLTSIHSLHTLVITRLIAWLSLGLDKIINHGRSLVDHIEVLHLPDPFDAVGAQYHYSPKLKTNRFHNS